MRFSLVHFLKILYIACVMVCVQVNLNPCAGKRAAPPIVPPIESAGVVISPVYEFNSLKEEIYIKVESTKTRQVICKKLVAQIVFDPDLERDVQEVFIQSLRIINGVVHVELENKKTYKLDLKTCEVN